MGDVDATTGSGYLNNATNQSDTCEADNNLVTIFLIPCKIIVVLMNAILFAAAVRDRKQLQRQNYTYQCVISTLLCNTLFVFMTIWLTIDNYPQSSSDPQKDQMSVEKYVWLITEAATASLMIGICANITSLTWVTLDSVFYVGRSGTDWGTTSSNEQPSKRRKGKFAKVAAITSWVVPLLLLLLALGWNCARNCKCPSNNFKFKGNHCDESYRCSNMWAPLKKDYLILIVFLWILEVLVLFVFLYRGVRKHQASTVIPPAGKDEDATTSAVDAMNMNEIAKEDEIVMTQRRKSSVLKRKFNTRLKFSMFLTVLLIVTMLPLTISTMIDVLMDSVPYRNMIVVSSVFVFVYCACCPVLMWIYLPSLRSSTLKLLEAIKNKPCGK